MGTFVPQMTAVQVSEQACRVEMFEVKQDNTNNDNNND